MDLSSIEQIIRTRVPNAPSDNVELYLDSVDRVLSRGGDYSDMSEDDVVEDFEYYIQSRMDEIKKPTTKMKKSELKEMIKAAFLSEADFTSGQDDDAAPAIASMYDPLKEAEEEKSLDDILADIIGTEKDPYMAEEIGANWDSTKPKDVGRKYVTAIKDAHLNLGIVSDIVQAGQFMDREFSDEIDNMQMYLNMLLQSTSGGNEPMMGNIKTQNMTAKEKDAMLKTPFTETLYEAEEEEIEVDAEEKIEKPANDSIVVDKRIVSLSSLPSDTRKILDSLETLRAQAEEFGDQKFITQVGNTITFFTRDFVVAGDEPTKAKVDESLEIIRMKKLAGLLTEGEYSKALLKESKKNITKEMLSSEEQETINYILGDNIEEVEMGTAQFDTVDNYDYQEVLSRLKRMAKKGLLTVAVLSTVLGALPAEAHSQIKDIASIEAGIEMDQVSNPTASFTKTQNKDIIKQIKSEFPGYVRTGNLGNGGASLNWGNVGGDGSAKVGIAVSYEPGNDFIEIKVVGDTQRPSQPSPAFQNAMNKAKELTFRGGSIDKSENQAFATVKVPTEKLPEVITFLKSTVNNLK